MPKQPSRDFRNFYIKDIPQDTFCPECHRLVRWTIPAELYTYFAHAIDDICVVDNEPVSLFDKAVDNGQS